MVVISWYVDFVKKKKKVDMLIFSIASGFGFKSFNL